MTGPSVRIEALGLSFGRTRVLDAVDLEIAGGESLALIGPNGAGKTSLVACLLGLVRPASGRVRIDGLAPDDPAVRRRLGYVPERCSVDRSLSPRGSLRLHHELSGRPRRVREGEVRELLALTGLEELADRPARTCSKGQLQRLAFAIALVGRPSLLVLDEPFSGVDPAGVSALRSLIGEARAGGATLLINSHRLDQVVQLCDRVALLARGRLQGVHAASGGERALRRLACAPRLRHRRYADTLWRRHPRCR